MKKDVPEETAPHNDSIDNRPDGSTRANADKHQLPTIVKKYINGLIRRRGMFHHKSMDPTHQLPCVLLTLSGI